MDIHKFLARMYGHRSASAERKRYELTMAYAISVKTGVCYIGWNAEYSQFRSAEEETRRKERWRQATGRQVNSIYENGRICAEASALSVALSYDEQLRDLIFVATNCEGEPFQPCDKCQRWLYPGAAGCLKVQDGTWFLQFYRDLDDNERSNLERSVSGGRPLEEDWFRENIRVDH